MGVTITGEQKLEDFGITVTDMYATVRGNVQNIGKSYNNSGQKVWRANARVLYYASPSSTRELKQDHVSAEHIGETPPADLFLWIYDALKAKHVGATFVDDV